MSTDLQPKIDKWWAGLTPEEREQWWELYDFCWNTDVPQGKVPLLLVLEDQIEIAITRGWVPAPCAQLWWKLEVWLGDELSLIHQYPAKDNASVKWGYALWLSEAKEAVKMAISDKDRRHALLDACLAVQRGEG